MTEGLIYKLEELERELLKKTAEINNYKEENKRLRHLIASVEIEMKQKFNDYMGRIMVYGQMPELKIQSYTGDSMVPTECVDYKRIVIPSFEISYIEKIDKNYGNIDNNYRYLFQIDEGDK